MSRPSDETYLNPDFGLRSPMVANFAPSISPQPQPPASSAKIKAWNLKDQDAWPVFLTAIKRLIRRHTSDAFFESTVPTVEACRLLPDIQALNPGAQNHTIEYIIDSWHHHNRVMYDTLLDNLDLGSKAPRVEKEHGALRDGHALWNWLLSIANPTSQSSIKQIERDIRDFPKLPVNASADLVDTTFDKLVTLWDRSPRHAVQGHLMLVEKAISLLPKDHSCRRYIDSLQGNHCPVPKLPEFSCGYLPPPVA